MRGSVPDGQDPGTPFGAFAFHVHFLPLSGETEMPMDGVAPEVSGGFSEVTGLEATMEPKVIKEGGRNYGPRQRAGPVTFATVVLKRGMMESRHLWRWWSLFAGADGARNGGWARSSRCPVEIILLRERQPVLCWVLSNAMPVKFRAGDLNARATEVAIEELHLAHEGLHMPAVT
jgi:phage tail-like protein